jgi:predicted translin family RNA/ssDNA-binding protein
MLEKKYFQKVRTDLLAYAEKRREVIKVAGDAQHSAKRAIFALQRDNSKEADESLKNAEALLGQLTKKYAKDVRIFDEGSFKAALEEYSEATLFKQFLDGKAIGEVKAFKLDSDAYVSGLCDVPGEILRYAIKSATERNFKLVKHCYEVAEAIISELVDMDLTGYNRQKFDQAKQALHKLQQVAYEVSLKE